MKDLFGMMKQAKELQSKMAEMQAEVESLQATGAAGAGLVSLTINGKGALIGLKLDPSMAKADEMELLEDLIIAAHADAKAKVDAEMAGKMQSLTGGMQLPPGLKLF
ncbi:MAG: YbaB/EbfC family nucleoid-associated protein [Hyphomicrobiales bacterium]|nr:YbaB/EbfC family nucleoid-associated protein [Hyphomicrobiales bacterium]